MEVEICIKMSLKKYPNWKVPDNLQNWDWNLFQSYWIDMADFIILVVASKSKKDLNAILTYLGIWFFACALAKFIHLFLGNKSWTMTDVTGCHWLINSPAADAGQRWQPATFFVAIVWGVQVYGKYLYNLTRFLPFYIPHQWI